MTRTERAAQAPARPASSTRTGWRSSAATGVGALLCAAALALPLLGAFRAPGAPMEEGKLLIAAELVLDGEVPHRDFEHFYGPGDVWAVAGASAVLGGPSITAERLVGLASTVALLAAVFAAARRAGAAAAVVATLTAGLVALPFGVAAYSWIAGVALTLWGVLALVGAAERASPRLATAGGALLALALLHRADLILATAVAAAVLVPALATRHRRRFLVGAAAGLTPYLVHVATAGPGPVLEWMVVTPLTRLRGGRTLPVPPPGGDLTAWFDLSAPRPGPSSFFPDPALVTQFRVFFWATAAVLVVLAGCAVVAWRRRHAPGARAVLALSAVTVALAPQMLQRADVTHVRFVAVVALALAPGVVATTLRLVDVRLPVPAVAVELGVLGALALVVAVPHYLVRLDLDQLRRGTGGLPVAEVAHAGRAFPVRGPEVVNDIQATLQRVDEVAPPGGSVYVGPRDLTRTNYSDAFLYHLLPDLEPASYFLEANTGVANREGSGLAEDLAAADVLILSSEFDNWREPNDSGVPGPTGPLEVVERHFCPEGDFHYYEVFVRCR